MPEGESREKVGRSTVAILLDFLRRIPGYGQGAISVPETVPHPFFDVEPQGTAAGGRRAFVDRFTTGFRTPGVEARMDCLLSLAHKGVELGEFFSEAFEALKWKLDHAGHHEWWVNTIPDAIGAMFGWCVKMTPGLQQ